MKMPWWEDLSTDQRNGFIEYLKKVSKLYNVRFIQSFGNPDLIKELLLPILEQEEVYIPEEGEPINALQQNWKMTNFQLVEKIHSLYKKMISPLSTGEATMIIDLTSRRLRHLAKIESICANKKKNRWIFTREELIDLVI